MTSAGAMERKQEREQLGLDGKAPRGFRLGGLRIPGAVETPVDVHDAMIKVYVVAEHQGPQLARPRVQVDHCCNCTSPSEGYGFALDEAEKLARVQELFFLADAAVGASDAERWVVLAYPE